MKSARSYEEEAPRRCLAMIDTRPPAVGGSELTLCKLEEGHDGPHEPMDYEAAKMLRLQAFLAQYGVEP